MSQGALPLPVVDLKTRWLSADCCLQEDGELRAVIVGGAALLRYTAGDRVHERLAAALIAESGAAPVRVVLEAFGLDDATAWRDRQRLRNGGVAELVAATKGGKRGPYKVYPAVVRRIVVLRAQGLSQELIARRVGVSQSTVHAVLAEQGGTRARREEETLPLEDAVAPVAAVTPAETASLLAALAEADGQSGTDVVAEVVLVTEAPAMEAPVLVTEAPAMEAPVPVTEAPAMKAPVLVTEAPAMKAPVPAAAVRDASLSRARPPEEAALYAMLGMTPDGEAEVVFEPTTAAPFAGVLLVLPALAATGLLEAARGTYGGLRRGIYGLRATLLTLFVMALLRRPRPEQLKGKSPAALGDILGLLRAPEVKTVRRKLTEIARTGKAHELWRGLAKRWLAERDDVLGVLYVDGHVRVYNGAHKLPKAHVTQKSLCMRATTDYWVNDVDGRPVFLVTAPGDCQIFCVT